MDDVACCVTVLVDDEGLVLTDENWLLLASVLVTTPAAVEGSEADDIEIVVVPVELGACVLPTVVVSGINE